MADLLTPESLEDKAGAEAGESEEKRHAPEREELQERVNSVKNTNEVRDFAIEVQDYEDPELRDYAYAALATKASELISDPSGEETARLVELALEDLELKPRAIKRFLNLARLLLQVDILRNPRREAEECRRLVTRTVHLMLNWPRVTRWLQGTRAWRVAGKASSPVEQLLETFAKVEDLKDWNATVRQAWGAEAAAALSGDRFFEFLQKTNDPDNPPGLREMAAAGLI